MIDEVAREWALTRWGLPECLHVPIAAVDETAITRHVGDIVRSLSRELTREAVLVRARATPQPDDRFPIWRIEASAIFRSELQVWVDVAYTRYRSAYRRAFPEEAIADKVLSHAMNRRVAALKGFRYVRITPTSRRANSSSSFSEEWGVTFHSTRDQMAANRRRGAFIQYADSNRTYVDARHESWRWIHGRCERRSEARSAIPRAYRLMKRRRMRLPRLSVPSGASTA